MGLELERRGNIVTLGELRQCPNEKHGEYIVTASYRGACPGCRADHQRTYRATEKGKAKEKRYKTSPKAREWDRNWYRNKRLLGWNPVRIYVITEEQRLRNNDRIAANHEKEREVWNLARRMGWSRKKARQMVSDDPSWVTFYPSGQNGYNSSGRMMQS